MDRLPLETEFLCRIELQVEGPQLLGAGPAGERRIFVITGGRVHGPVLEAAVLPGGTDWLIIGADGATRLDVRMAMQTTDGQIVGVTYGGVRHMAPDLASRMAAGEELPPGSYYMRTLVRFEAGPGPLGWLTRVVAIGVGHRFARGPVYDVYAVL